MNKGGDRLSEKVRKSAEELKRARGGRSAFWHSAYVIGVGGWLFVLPTMGGVCLGRVIDKSFKGEFSWTIMLAVLGIAAGFYNVWYFFFRE